MYSNLSEKAAAEEGSEAQRKLYWFQVKCFQVCNRLHHLIMKNLFRLMMIIIMTMMMIMVIIILTIMTRQLTQIAMGWCPWLSLTR